jgi:hypothetical protein
VKPTHLILDNDTKYTEGLGTESERLQKLPNFRRLSSLRIPHSELRNSKVIPKGPTEIVCHERLGGLIKSYERRAI